MARGEGQEVIRNAHLRAQHERQLGIVRTIREAGIAALILDALPDKTISAATGIPVGTIGNTITVLMRRAGVKNRVGLALALKDLV